MLPYRFLRRTMALGLVAGSAGLAACGISTQQEVAIGQQYATEINSQLPIVTDASINRYINLLGNELARHGIRKDIQYTFYVVNTNQLNAFAIPGGYVYINRGIIERAANVSELAGVMAHEIGHVEERHSVEMMEKAQGANLGISLAYILMGRAPTGVERAAIDIGGSAIFARFGRQAELEADADGVALTTAAGIDPHGLPSFFNVLLQERKRSPAAVEQWFATHPIEEDRIELTNNLIAQLPQDRLRSVIRDTEQFRTFKARVRQLPAPPPERRQ